MGVHILASTIETAGYSYVALPLKPIMTLFAVGGQIARLLRASNRRLAQRSDGRSYWRYIGDIRAEACGKFS